jgi:hypothetical protein
MRSSNVAASQGKYLLNLFITYIISISVFITMPLPDVQIGFPHSLPNQQLGTPFSGCGDTSAPKIKLQPTNQKVFQIISLHGNLLTNIHKQNILSKLDTVLACEDFIPAGRVCLNGKGAEFGQNVNPIVDKIPVDGESIAAVESLISIALYKQRNVTCSHPCFGNNDGSAANNFYLKFFVLITFQFTYQYH